MLNTPIRPIELLAPARDFEQGKAAILCGADALYVGGPRFGARALVGVSVAQIEELAHFAHRYGAKLYVAMNTLLYEAELSEAQQQARALWEAGADALIVQDMAFLRMDLPPIELHASTQVYNADPRRAQFLYEAGFSRLITERALSLEQIEEISKASPIEVEAFVHGAICVGYSGRCFLSRTMGSRSGNRGACSQACRLPYNLLDDEFRPLLEDQHLLSVRDLNLSTHLERMIDRGVNSFKIEGRLKDMSYVRNVVAWYRQQLDEIIDRRADLTRSSCGTSTVDFLPDPLKSFSRGFTSYYLNGFQTEVSSFETPKALGEPLGVVTRISKEYFELSAANTLTLCSGDGICLITEHGGLVGVNLNAVKGSKIYPNRMDRIKPGLWVYRNHDHRFVTAVNRSRLRRSIPARGRVQLRTDSLLLELSATEVNITVERKGTFEPARQGEEAIQTIRRQLSKCGDTLYTLTHLEIDSDPPLFVPASLLGELRREAFEALDVARARTYIPRARRAENLEVTFPQTTLSGAENVVNSLARSFYQEHGVREIEPGYDLRKELKELTVMRMRYCLRREIGKCLLQKSTYRGALYLEHGPHLYALNFDCTHCEMSLVYQGVHKKNKKIYEKNNG